MLVDASKFLPELFSSDLESQEWEYQGRPMSFSCAEVCELTSFDLEIPSEPANHS